ncbi:MAG: hypothetical protein JWQ38_1137 [Flavipsychrobacter sp.]|nr:hypothetical protein [Flavipsychrobacter sp.]
MNITTTKDLTLLQKEAILRLWNNEYPATLQYNTIAEFDNYLAGLTGHKHYLLTSNDDQVMGWGFTFLRDEEKWFAIIIDGSLHKQGYGTKLLNALKAEENKLYGWATDYNNAVKSDGSTYNSPLEFYTRHNFSIHPDIRLETEKLSAVKISWSK